MHTANRLRHSAKAAAKRLVMPLLETRFRHGIRPFAAPYSLHLGCGSHHLDGWVNIDFIESPAVDLWWNLGLPLPLPDASCRFIFHEHVLEHFELSRGLELLRECRRLLAPGGLLRVAMPSLDDMLEKCANGEWETHGSAHMPEVETRAEYLNILFRYWGHRWIYDHDELRRRLREAGFRDIADQELRQSTHMELRGIEYRDNSLLICEATKAGDG